MDLSKLPRLSKTDTPPGDPTVTEATGPPIDPQSLPPVPVAPVAAVNFCANCGAPLRPGARFCDSCGVQLNPHSVAYSAAAVATPGMGAEVWVSAIIGLLLILLGRSFGGWLLARISGRQYDTGVTWAEGNTAGHPAGQMVDYWNLEGFKALTDSALFLFGLAMVLEALVLALVFTKFRAKVPLILVALGITLLATAYNLFVSFKLLAASMVPLMSLLAVAFGGYIAVYEWRLLQQFRGAAPGRTN